MQPSNTPPDGDFVRYVEELTRANSAAASAASAAAARPEQRSQMYSAPSPVKASSVPSPANPGKLAASPQVKSPDISFATHIKWVFAAFIMTQLLSRYVPGAKFLFIPALCVYAAWVISRLKRTSRKALMTSWSGMTQRVAEEIKKAQRIQQERQKNKP